MASSMVANGMGNHFTISTDGVNGQIFAAFLNVGPQVIFGVIAVWLGGVFLGLYEVEQIRFCLKKGLC